jgi:hypothetical protein
VRDASARARSRAQCERWGIFFLPGLGIASLIALARGGSMYRDNAFEREAYDTAG